MKKYRMFQYLLFAVVIIVGIITIVSSDDGEKTENFKECNVLPQFRCPDDDVRAHWSTSPDTPIKIIYEDKEVEKEGHGDYVISAADVNSLPDPFTVTLKVNTPNGESREFKIETVRGLETYLRTGLRIEETFRYKIDMLPEIWSDDIIVHSIKLTNPRYYTCTGSLDQHNLQWQFDKGTTISGYLVREGGFETSFDPQPTISGTWYFTIQNPSSELYCPGWKLTSTELSPQVEFTVSCK